MNLILEDIFNKIMQSKKEGNTQYNIDLSKFDDPYHIVKSLTNKGFKIDFDHFPNIIIT